MFVSRFHCLVNWQMSVTKVSLNIQGCIIVLYYRYFYSNILDNHHSAFRVSFKSFHVNNLLPKGSFVYVECILPKICQFTLGLPLYYENTERTRFLAYIAENLFLKILWVTHYLTKLNWPRMIHREGFINKSIENIPLIHKIIWNSKVLKIISI